jgi:hypothetical protein
VSVVSSADINGPWDMTAVSFGDITELFVTNVLNGTVAGVSAPGATLGSGALFGLAIAPHNQGVYFVDDSTNQLDLLGR